MSAARFANSSRKAMPEREPLIDSMLLNSGLAERAAQGSICAAHTNPYEGFTSRTEHCLGGFRRL